MTIPLDTLYDALYGNPPTSDFKPSRDGVYQAVSELVALIDGKVNSNDARLPQFPINNQVALLGDSITAAGVANGVIPTISTDALALRNMNRGMTYWLPFLTNQNFRSPQSLNFGISGQTTSQIAARVGDVVNSGAGTCVVEMGTNNAGTNNYAATIADFETTFSALAAANILIVVIPILPRTISAGDTATQGFINKVNLWLMNAGALYPNYKFIDPYLFGEPYSTTMSPRDGYTYDGLHPTAIGMRYICKPIAEYLNTLVPVRPRQLRTVTDYFSVDNPTGYCNLNPMVAGTAGTVGSGVTGTCADNWSLNKVAGGGDVSSLTVVGSSDTSDTGLIAQKIVIGGSASGGYQTIVGFDQYNFSNSVDGKLKAGDVVECIAEIEVIGGAVGVSGVSVYLMTTQAGQAHYSWDGYAIVSEDLTVDGYKGVFRTPAQTLTADNTLAACGIWVYLRNTGTTRALTLKIVNVAVRKVAP
jgi:lysophospholipase L1-like esterase